MGERSGKLGRVAAGFGWTLRALAIGVGSLLLIAVLVRGMVWASAKALPWLRWGPRIVFDICFFVLLPLCVFRKTRPWAGTAFVIASYAFGLMLFAFSCIVAFEIWGYTGLIIGLVFFGVGTVPVAFLATLLHGEWWLLLNIVLGVVFTFGTRFLGIYLASKKHPPERKAAEQGEPRAQRELGFAYEFGQDVPQDYTQAAAWFRKAAEQGDAEAQYFLGTMYAAGQGVPQDDTQAVAWYRRAAEQGVTSAQTSLGLSYHEGRGVPQNYTQAYFWLDIVAAGEVDAPLAELAAKYRDKAASHLAPADLARAQEWARKWRPGFVCFPSELLEDGAVPIQTKIVRRLSPEEEELAQKREELELLQNQLAERELFLANLRAELAAFEGQYLWEVGVLYAELDDWNARIAESVARQEGTEEARAAARQARSEAEESHAAAHGEAAAPGEFSPSPELKSLYREAAKRVHPDLATDDADRQRRELLMKEANRAYQEGDADALRRIIEEYESSPESVKGAGVGADLVRVIRQIKQVRVRLAQIELEIASLADSETAKLKAKAEEASKQGRDLLAEMAENVKRRVEAARRRYESRSMSATP